MIVIEDILEEVFKQLPPYVQSPTRSFPVKFSWGNQEDLTLFLETNSGNNYPLIWYVPNKEKHQYFNHDATSRLKLFIAKDSEDQNRQNPDVWKTEFKDCLNPLLANVITCLTKSGATKLVEDGAYTVERFANYVEYERNKSEQHTKTIDYWNVIVLEIDVYFKETAVGQVACINKINFPKHG